MIPGEYDITIYRGDTYFGPLITLPDLSGFGGPSDLTTAVLTAQIRAKDAAPDALVDFTVEIVDEAARIIRLTLASEDTVIQNKTGMWDLQITDGDWSGTPLRGAVTFTGQVTR